MVLTHLRDIKQYKYFVNIYTYTTIHLLFVLLRFAIHNYNPLIPPIDSIIAFTMKVSNTPTSAPIRRPTNHPYIGLFLHTENQTILWKTICSSSSWNAFTRVVPTTPESWFRNIIEHQYSQILSDPLPDPSTTPRLLWLRQTNIQTIERLVSSMASYTGIVVRENNTPTANIQASAPTPAPGGFTAYTEETPTLVYTAPRKYDTPAISPFNIEHERNEKQERAKREFESYQSQYNSLLARPVPTTPVFSETIQGEERITNMDELLKQQHAMREQDVAALLPPSPPPNDGAPTPETSPFVDRDNIKHEVLQAVLRKDDGAKNEQRWTSYSLNATTGACSELRKDDEISAHENPRKNVSWAFTG
jgi:hypothetical protein